MNTHANSSVGDFTDRRQWLALCGLFAVLAILLGGYLWQEHRAVEEAEARQLVRLGNILDEVLNTRLRSIYGTLDEIRHGADWLPDANSKATSRLLQALGKGMLSVRTITVMDAKGIVQASNRAELLGVDLSKREYFQRASLGNDPRILYVSSPFTTKLGAYAINLVRVSQDEKGRFKGIVAVTLDPNYFSTLLESFRHSPDMWLAIAHEEGTQFLMVPERKGMSGLSLSRPGGLFTRHMESGRSENILTGIADATGDDCMMELRTVRPAEVPMDKALVVQVCRSRGAIFAPWRSDVELGAGLFAIFVVSSVLLMAGFQRRRRAGHALVRQKEETLGSIINSLDATIALLAADGTILQVNEAWSRFGHENGANEPLCLGVGLNYIAACRNAAGLGDSDAPEILRGLESVTQGRQRSFRFEYPCHCRDHERWFLLSATLTGHQDQFVISHLDITQLKLAQRAELEFVELANSAMVPLAILDTQQRYRIANKAYATFVGMSQESLVGKSVHEVLGEQNYLAIEQHILNALAGEPQQFHIDRYFNNLRTSIDAAYHPIVEGGHIIGLVASIHDITDLINSQAALKLHQDHLADMVRARTRELEIAESRMRLVIDSAADGIIELDPAGTIQLVNPAAASLLGYSPTELIGRNVHEAIHYQYADGTPYPSSECAIVSAVRMGRRLRQDSDVFWHANGHAISVSIASHPIWNENRISGAVLSFADVTARDLADKAREDARQAAEALAAAHLELAQQAQTNANLYEYAPLGYHSLDPQGIVINANATELAMLGYAREEYVGQPFVKFLTPDSQALFRERFVEFRNSGKVRDLDYDMVCKDGNILPVLISADMVVGPNGEFLHNRATMSDNRERKARERQIAEMSIELARRAEVAEKMARTKSEFLANMSHEIRTPLNGVLGMAQIGYRDSVGRGEAQHTYSRILDSGKLLLTIINDILDFSKIEAGKLEVESVPLDPAELVDQAINTMAPVAQAKGLTLKSEQGDLPPACLGDPVRISQVLLNLLSNAAKFTPAGEVRLSVRTEGEHLVFSVADSGIGIGPNELERLFMPFEQADSSTTRKFGGTGLGLAISRRLAELMGGTLTVSSVVGQGSTFVLKIPLHEAQLPIRGTGMANLPADNRLSGLRILVAEDNEINQLVIEDFLTQEGAKVTLADNGRLAVEAIDHAPIKFDVVLMDVQMPEMDGLEATRRIRLGHPDLPIVGQTAHALKAEHDKCLAAGMMATVTKPINIDALVAAILDQVKPSESRPPAPPPVVDAEANPDASDAIRWDVLTARNRGRPEFIDRLVATAIREHGQMARKIRDCINAEDLSELGRLAHLLKGLAGTLEAPQASRLAARVMQMAGAGDTAALTHAMDMAVAVERLMAELQQRLLAQQSGGNSA